MAEDKKTKGPDKTPDGDLVVRTEGRDFRVEGNDVDGYIGVDPEYRGYANETDRPYVTDEDIALLEKGGVATDVEALTIRYAERARRLGATEVKAEESDAGSDDVEDKEPKAPAKAAPAKVAPPKAAASADPPKNES